MFSYCICCNWINLVSSLEGKQVKIYFNLSLSFCGVSNTIYYISKFCMNINQILVQYIVVIILLNLLLSFYQTHYNQTISLLKILYLSYFHQFLFFASLQLLFIISLFKFSILWCLSSASTTIFFIFYIALTMTIYTRIHFHLSLQFHVLKVKVYWCFSFISF